jgi:hypothetical protein
LQSAKELEVLSSIMGGKKPETPFSETSIYPYFATFAAFFGETAENKRLPAILRLARGTDTLREQVSLNDRAFLLFVYATFCCNLPQPKLWYFSAKASTTIKKIMKWMKHEDFHNVGRCAELTLKNHLGKIEAELADAIAADSGDEEGSQEEGDGGSDSDI